jgi:hypothetical protein
MPEADHWTTFSAGFLDRGCDERALLAADRSAAGRGVRTEHDDVRTLDPAAGDNDPEPAALVHHIQ